MKTIIKLIAICFVLGLSFSFGQAMCAAVPVTDEADIKDESGVKIEDVLKDFFDFCAKSKNKDPEVEEVIKDFKKKIEEGTIFLNPKDSEEGVFLDFSTVSSKPGVYCLPIHSLKYYKNSPSIVFTNIIYLAANIKDFIPGGDPCQLVELRNIERLIKPVALQAKFIDKYLSKSKLKLTPYEKAILTSYKDNNMYDFLFKYYAIDAEWLDYLDEVFSSESTSRGKLKQLRDIGEKKIEESKLKFKEGATEEEIYNALVMPNMYCELIPYFVYTMTEGKKSGKTLCEFDWAAVDTKLAETMAKLKEIITPHLGGLEYSYKQRLGISKIPVKSETK